MRPIAPLLVAMLATSLPALAWTQDACGPSMVETGVSTADLNMSKVRVTTSGLECVVATPWVAGSDVWIHARANYLSTFSPIASIPIPSGTASTGFGESLDIDGALLAVAHTGDDSVWIYDISAPASPVFQDRIPISLPAGSFLLDNEVEIGLSGDLLLVPHTPTAAIPSGHIAVFERDPASNSWSRTSEVTPPAILAPGTNAWGRAFDFDGTHLCVGDPEAEGGLGSASIFLREPTGAWRPLLETVGTVPGEGLGHRIALDNGQAAVGNRSQFERKVEVLRVSPFTGDWAHEQTLRPPFPQPFINGVNFGDQIAMDWGTLLVATPYFHINPQAGNFPEGMVSIYELDPQDQRFTHQRNLVNEPATFPHSDGIFWGHALDLRRGLATVANLFEPAGARKLRVDTFLARAIDCDLNGVLDACEIGVGKRFDHNRNGYIDSCEEAGERYCGPAALNSAGERGRLTMFGTPRLLMFHMRVQVAGLPPNGFGFVLASQGNGVVPNPGGSLGGLCLAGAPIARSIGGLQSSGVEGRFRVSYRIPTVPLPSGTVAIQPGDTWYFQAWYLDQAAATRTSFTDAVGVTFTAL